jgi:hypothetical protein
MQGTVVVKEGWEVGTALKSVLRKKLPTTLEVSLLGLVRKFFVVAT